MATIKSYTDISQSKVLEKIFPLESADMWYQEYETVIGDDYGYTYRLQPYNDENIEGLPCWKLATLLNILPLPQLSKDKIGDGKWDGC